MKIFGKYYIDFSDLRHDIEKGKFGPFDENGIPLMDFNKNKNL